MLCKKRIVTSGLTIEDLVDRIYRTKKIRKDYIPGYQCSGQVYKLGANVTNLAVGDRVFCLNKRHCCSQFLCLTSDRVNYYIISQCWKIPPDMSYSEAAGTDKA